MDFDKDGMKITKLSDDNYHTWKSRIQLILSLKELDEYIEDDPPSDDSDKESLRKWRRCDSKAKAVIGLTLSDTHLEQVQHAEAAKEMWNMIIDISEKHII